MRRLAIVIVMAILAAACSSSGDELAAESARAGGVLADRTPETTATQPVVTVPPPPATSAETPGVIVGHVVGGAITAHAEASADSAVVAELSNPTEVGGPLAFRLVDSAVPTGAWTEVHLPVRPNGTTGYVPTERLQLTRNPYRISIDRAAHQLQVHVGDELWIDTLVAIGTGNTPTPVGSFYIIELLQPPSPNGVYGPFAFGLSGFSETLTSFAGGDGVIGIHGTNDPGAIGSDVSHGCVRVHNDVISTLAGVIPLGTPVVIT